MKGVSNKGVSGILSGILGLLVILMVTAEIQGQNRGEIVAIRRSATLTPENLRIVDPELYDIIAFLFPTREEFFTAMGWSLPNFGTLFFR